VFFWLGGNYPLNLTIVLRLRVVIFPTDSLHLWPFTCNVSIKLYPACGYAGQSLRLEIRFFRRLRKLPKSPCYFFFLVTQCYLIFLDLEISIQAESEVIQPTNSSIRSSRKVFCFFPFTIHSHTTHAAIPTWIIRSNDLLSRTRFSSILSSQKMFLLGGTLNSGNHDHARNNRGTNNGFKFIQYNIRLSW